MYVEFPRKLWEADHDWNILGSVMSSGVTTAGAVADQVPAKELELNAAWLQGGVGVGK